MSTPPMISVVTVCFNAAESIERTIRSVQEQSYRGIEHIIVDGASTDGTMEIVRRHAASIAKIVSEKDDGIFDAMNKAIALATGELVYFLNADDWFIDDAVLRDIARVAEEDPSRRLIYGNVILKDGPEGVLNFPARPFKSYSVSEFLHNSFCHQAVFVRRSMFDEFGLFDKRYRYSADYEWIIRAFKRRGGRDFHFVDRNIAYYSMLGRSSTNAAVTSKEVIRMQFGHFLSLEYLWYYFRYVLVRGLRARLRTGSGKAALRPEPRAASGAITSGRRDMPSVTVVTIVFNGVQVIERTLRSVVAQDYPRFEYLVVDGRSTDGTIDVVRRYEAGITRWVSEKDGGAYAAMNRGAAMATGEWIIFMNGGDLFAAPDALSRVFGARDWSDTDVIYGDGIFCGADYRFVERAPDALSLKDGSGFSHQSCFVRTALQQEYGFDPTEKVAADYDLFLRLRKSGKVFRKTDVVVSEFFADGISTMSASATIQLQHRVYKKHLPRSDLVMYRKLAIVGAKRLMRAVFPQSAWNGLKRLYHRKSRTPLES